MGRILRISNLHKLSRQKIRIDPKNPSGFTDSQFLDFKNSEKIYSGPVTFSS